MRKSKKSDGQPPGAGWRERRLKENTFSFVLRVRIDMPSMTASPRANFRLEDVVGGQEWRFTDYPSAAERLRICVNQIINRTDPA
ncbi:MAG: hypothetical protein GY789_17885 [Hyphomicrobiales bacterium]|nr:hypothetical protein [Hyphomicrobiales bacterium]